VDFIPDGSVDVLFGKGLLCCMADHAGVLREIKRLLRPDGLAYLSVRKGGSRTDPRRVGENEWDQILSNFFVDQRGDGWTNRWAWVRSNSETCPKRVQ
jgi:SAM-dependent methyltransferase